MAKLKDYTNMIFGQFKVIQDLGMKYPKPNSKQKRKFLKVKCSKCHLEYEGLVECFSLGQKICDCDKRILKSKEWKRIAKIRLGMIDRCHNEKSKDYSRYGQKNIRVCYEWLISCESFYKWSIDNNYNDDLQIDRIDNDKGYSPENCRWTTKLEQARNKRKVTKIEKIINAKKLLNEGLSRIQVSNKLNLTYGIVKHLDRGTRWKDIN